MSLCSFPTFGFNFVPPHPSITIPTISIGISIGFSMPPCPLD